MKTIHPAIAEHVMEENERLRDALRRIAGLPLDPCSTENDYRLAGAKAIAEGALSQQAEPAPAQDEQQPTVVPEGWLIELGFDVLDMPFRFVESKSHTPTIKVVLPPCEPDDSSSWNLRDEVAQRIGSVLAAPIAQTAPQPSEESLVQNAKALLALDERGALAPHGIGGLAREVIEKLIAHIERTTPQPEQSALSGKCWIEVIGGREGPSIYIGDGEIAHRLAGNKPWGGGRTLHSFKVDVAELVREASALAIQGSSKP